MNAKIKKQNKLKKMNTGEKIILIFNAVFLGLFALATIYSGILPSQDKFGLYGAPIPLFTGAVALIGILFWLMEYKVKSTFFRKNYRYLVIIGFALSIGVQIVIAHALRSYGYTWDSNTVYTQAVAFANHGSINDTLVSYFAINPNNIPLLAMLGSLFSFFKTIHITDYLTISIAINVLLMSLTQVLIFLTTKMLYGRKVAAISMLFSFVFISLSMYVQIAYTDTLTIIFPILILFLALHFTKQESIWMKLLLSFLIGLVTIVGYLIKPTVLIAFVALIVVGLFYLIKNIKRTSKTQLLVYVGCLAIAAITGFGAYRASQILIDELQIVPFSVTKTNETSMPSIHFFSMGLKTTVYPNMVEYGGYDDNEAHHASLLLTQQEKTNYSISLIKERLGNYGPFGYIKFLAHKANWIMSDSTFYAYGEGSNANVVFTSTDKLSTFIRSFMYSNGPWYILFANILQIFWLAILILIAVQVLITITNRLSNQNLYAVLPRMMIAGILLFLLLFEGRSRYIFLFLPVFIVAAMYTINWFNTAHDHGDKHTK